MTEDACKNGSKQDAAMSLGECRKDLKWYTGFRRLFTDYVILIIKKVIGIILRKEKNMCSGEPNVHTKQKRKIEQKDNGNECEIEEEDGVMDPYNERDQEISFGEPRKNLVGGCVRLLSDSAIIQPEVRNQYQDFVMHNVGEIYKFISTEDPRFSDEVILTGGVKKALKHHLPYEDEFNFVLAGLNTEKMVNTSVSHTYSLTRQCDSDPCQLKDIVTSASVLTDGHLEKGDVLEISEKNADMAIWGSSSDVVRDGCIVADLVLQLLYNLLLRAVKKIKHLKGKIIKSFTCLNYNFFPFGRTIHRLPQQSN